MIMAVLWLILWTLALGFLGFLAVVIYQKTYWRSKGIPYIDTIPIIEGLLPILLRKKSLVEMTLDSYNACPGTKYYGSMDFFSPILMIKDPEIVKEVTVKSFDHFPNHRSFVEEDFDPILSRNIFSLKDDRWRQMRTTLSPSFTASKMKYMFQLVSKCSVDFVDYLKKHSAPTEDIDLKDTYTRYTNDVIATTAFGISVNSLEDRDNDFYVNGKGATKMDGFMAIIKMLFAVAFPKLMRSIGLTLLPKKSDKFFKSLIYNTVKSREEKGIVRPDMIHLLMQAKNDKNGFAMTTDDIIAQAFIFFLAGFDTSARLMCFVSHVLSYDPEVQDRLREEIDSTFEEEKENITYETLGRMKYLDMVFMETLRLYPPTPFLDRVCAKTYELPPATENSRPYTVHLNDSLWIPIIGYHRDPNYFPEPDKFDPERFSDDNKDRIKPYTYMPFGVGPRKCIGERFALMETKILIIRLLQNFVFKASKKTTKSIEFAKDGSLMSPENGFWMRLEPRIKE